ncbi:MAG: glycosyltransferase family A protein [Bacteroidales bacterium]|nr:glycosyltransferase family A protein [Bacteroidales bacterium]
MKTESKDCRDSITVVVPVRNRAGIVCRTLDSIAEQTYRPVRLIVVDNGSTDSTLDVITDWASRHRDKDFMVSVLSEPRPGACRARNKGLDAVETEWTMFFDSDDLMAPGHIARAMSEADSDVDVVGWDYVLKTKNGKQKLRRFYQRDFIYNNLFHSMFGTVRYMARTSLFRRAGGWLDDAAMFDDAELGMRLLALNPCIRYAGPEITLTILESESSIMTARSGRLQSMHIALDAMQRTMPADTRHWVDLMRILMALTWARHDAASGDYVRRIIDDTSGLRRHLWRFFAFYTRHGGRGVAHIYSLLRYLGF